MRGSDGTTTIAATATTTATAATVVVAATMAAPAEEPFDLALAVGRGGVAVVTQVVDRLEAQQDTLETKVSFIQILKLR